MAKKKIQVHMTLSEVKRKFDNRRVLTSSDMHMALSLSDIRISVSSEIKKKQKLKYKSKNNDEVTW